MGLTSVPLGTSTIFATPLFHPEIRPQFRFSVPVVNAVKRAIAAVYASVGISAMMGDDPDLKRRGWEALRAIPMDDLIAQGRTYPGGLHKLEPRELDRVGIVLSSG